MVPKLSLPTISAFGQGKTLVHFRSQRFRDTLEPSKKDQVSSLLHKLPRRLLVWIKDEMCGMYDL
jgi:hypothetical protein